MFPQGGAYIAGAMRGKPDCGFPAFFEAESWLLANTDFFPIFNPARRDVEHTGVEFRGVTEFDGEFDLEEAMTADLDFINSDDCAVVVVLEDWHASEGTHGEMREALTLSKPIVYLNKTNYGFTLWPEAAIQDYLYCPADLKFYA